MRILALNSSLKIALAFSFCIASSIVAAIPVVDDSSSAHARVRPVGLDEVRWTRGFWADRFALCRDQMVPGMERLMAGTNYTQYLKNFEIAAGLAEGRSRGAPFNDGDFYKWLEGACAVLAVTHDAKLDRAIEHDVEVIGRAQRADGYLHTPVLIKQRNGDTNAHPFQSRNNFEVYNLGHLMTAACLHYRVTGRTNLLAIACKAADFLDRSFRNPTPELARNSICPSHYMGLIELYRTTKETRYLELARRVIAMRDLVKDGGDDNQDRIPFTEQDEALGHAVRANYLYAGVADLFAETGDTNLWPPLERIWTNVVEKKLYITGGCGALYDGASPYGSKDQGHITRTHQAYGYNYQLPNTTAHSETCANIGNVLWNWRMFLVTGEARFMDVVELALYNSVLSGVGLDGTNFFYTNPLRVTDPLPTKLRWSRTRVPFVSSFCCPPNVVRTVAEVSGYAYGKTKDAIWVNLYGSSKLETRLGNDQPITLTQETDYPWNGHIRLRVDECGEKVFALKLRIPGWARGASIRVNGRLVATAKVAKRVRDPESGGDLLSPHPNPLPEEREQVAPVVRNREAPRLAAARDPTLPLPKGEGRGEGKGGAYRLMTLARESAAKRSVRRTQNQTALGERRSGESSESDIAGAAAPFPGTYFELRRAWQPGDIVELDLPMPTELFEANPLVEETLNQVAVKRGPIVYCLESADLPEGTRVMDVCVPADAKFLARYDRRLLGGVVVLDGTLFVRPGGHWDDKLYRPLKQVPLRPIKTMLIPYYVWGNREAGEMTVWLRRL